MLNIQGIFEIELGGETRKMKATFGAIEKLEGGLLKKPIIEILSAPYQLAATEIANIIYVGLTEASDTRKTRKEVGEMVFEGGVVNYLKPCIEYLTYLYTGGREAKGSTGE